MYIKDISFNKKQFEPDVFKSLNFQKGYNWPVVYLIENGKMAYIGETTYFRSRMLQHMEDPEKAKLNKVHCIVDNDLNKSAILDIEAKLIDYFAADQKLKLLNLKGGNAYSQYYDKTKYINKVPVIWDRLKSRGLVQKTIFEIENSDLFKFSPYKSLSDEQLEISEMVLDDIDENDSTISFIEGNPGTGKTVLAMYFLKQLAHKYGKDNVALVVAMDSLRKSLRNVAKSIQGLQAKNVIKPSEAILHNYEVLIVDEAHRLKRRKNLAAGGEYASFDRINEYLGYDNTEDGHQLNWILTASSHHIFFYDENQSVKPTDIPKSVFTKLKLEKYDFRTVTQYSLEQQHRVKGGVEYIKFVDDFVTNNLQEKIHTFQDYSVKHIESFDTFNKQLYETNAEYGLCRMVAGYSWKWISKGIGNEDNLDITIEGIKKRWNTAQSDWVNSPFSLDEVGCIHTIQGYDLNYVFLIFGREIDYNHNSQEFIINKDLYFDTNGKNGIRNKSVLRDYILNIYKTMMTRGIQGIFMYACNQGMKEYLRKYIITE